VFSFFVGMPGEDFVFF